MARRNARFFDRATERRLIEALQRGDEQAFTTIYTTYRVPLIRHAMNFTHSRARAEDIVQDVCFKVWVDHATVNVRDSLTGYLFRAVRNRAYDLGRRDAHLVMEPLPTDEEEVAALGFAREDAEEDAHCGDVMRVVTTVVRSLTPQVRHAFLLSWDDDVTYETIARCLHLAESTVRQHLMKARHRCWDLLIHTGAVDEHQRFRGHHGRGHNHEASRGIHEPPYPDREVPIPVHYEPGVRDPRHPDLGKQDIGQHVGDVQQTLEELIRRLLTRP